MMDEDVCENLEDVAQDVVEGKFSKDTGHVVESTLTGGSGDTYVVVVTYRGSSLDSVADGVDTDYGVARIDFVFQNSVGVAFDKEVARKLHERRVEA